MSGKVTVDREDLITLLMVTGVIKNLERAFGGVNSDTDRRAALPGYEAAHVRLNQALNAATRAERQAAIDQPLTEDEEQILREWPMLEEKGLGSTLPNVITLTPPGVAHDKRRYDGLAARGYVTYGNAMNGVKWGNEPDPVWRIDPTKILIGLTPDGQAKRKELRGNHDQQRQ